MGAIDWTPLITALVGAFTTWLRMRKDANLGRSMRPPPMPHRKRAPLPSVPDTYGASDPPKSADSSGPMLCPACGAPIA